MITAKAGAWETDGRFTMPGERFLEYTAPSVKKLVSLSNPRSLRKLQGIPSILMYETEVKHASADVVRFGIIRDIRVEGVDLSFSFKESWRGSKKDMQPKIASLKLDPNEDRRTHWAVKEGKLDRAFLEQIGRREPWLRQHKLAIIGLCFTCFGIIIAFTREEVRGWIGLSRPLPPRNIDNERQPQADKRTPAEVAKPDVTEKPSDIIAKVEGALPYARARVAEAYLGNKIKWSLVVRSIDFDGDVARLTLTESDESFHYVFCRINVKSDPSLKVMTEGVSVRLTGKISEIKSVWIQVDDASISRLQQSDANH